MVTIFHVPRFSNKNNHWFYCSFSILEFVYGQLVMNKNEIAP